MTVALCSGMLVFTIGAGAAEDLPARVPLTLVDKPTHGCQISPSFHQLKVEQGRARLPYPSADGGIALERRDGQWIVDRNTDGKLDDADLPLVDKNGTFSLPYLFAGRTRAFLFRIFDLAGDDKVMIHGLSHLAGTAGGRWFAIGDGWPANLHFGDFGQDALYIGSSALDATRLQLRPVLSVDERLWDCTLVDQGATLAFAPHAGPEARVQVTLDMPVVDGPAVRIVDGNLSFDADGNRIKLELAFTSAAAGQAPLPGRKAPERGITIAGPQHAWGHLTLRLPEHRTTKDGQKTDLLELYTSFPDPFPLPAGETRLTLGIPDRFAPVACMADPGLVLVETVDLVDAHGNAWHPRRTGEDGTTVAFLIAADGRETPLGTLEYG
jgi:hypothetical protein